MKLWSEIKVKVFDWLTNRLLPEGAATGQVPVKQADGTWSGGSVSSLPSMTSNSGKFLTTDGTSASWATFSGWVLGGNTLGSIGSLGTIDNFDLSLIRNNQEKLRFKSNELVYNNISRVTLSGGFFYDTGSGSPYIQNITGSVGLIFRDMYGNNTFNVAAISPNANVSSRPLSIKKALSFDNSTYNYVSIVQSSFMQSATNQPYFDIAAGGIKATGMSYPYNRMRLYVSTASDGVVGNITLCHNGGSVGIGISQPDISAELHVSSTTKGSLPVPRMSATQAETIASPADGLLVFVNDVTTPGSTINSRGYWWYDLSNSSWTKL